MEINYRRFYHRVKRKYPFIEHQINTDSNLPDICLVSSLYARYCQLQLNPEIALHNFEPRIRFIAVIVRMDDPNFMDDSSPMRKGLASKLAEVLGCERTIISHSLKTVKNYMVIYPHFRKEVDYFYGKLTEK